jgi:hypothetical protein
MVDGMVMEFRCLATADAMRRAQDEAFVFVNDEAVSAGA